MAARTRKTRHDDFTRERIQTSQLVNRLTDHVLKGTEMSKTQVAAALGLLKKSLPDLSAVKTDVEVKQSYVAHIPAPAPDTATWLKQVGK